MRNKGFNPPDTHKEAKRLRFLRSIDERTQIYFVKVARSALIELTRLSERLTLKPRAKPVSEAPLPDEPIQGHAVAANISAIEKQMRYISASTKD
ncbi:hypothetical protein GP910_00445 [Escherichia coli]|nr:hypothetical protein GP724_00445 [Escherichia coli]KAE9760876.1 hypothetical protein GP728_00445 [Enterobacteriaceae bacterium TzEc084]KAE9898757.1 hypothetical protein GP696_02820 [Enterobacteriaceae bacterium TzEc052]MVY20850.1 hypothetical protein [Enterobacteriaceae bacterium 8376wB8]MVY90252.1 hypothetical protein [Enterobacteriaceae bacterium 8376wD7]MVZ07746.1 hypothetical protein [Enterobacteriaceae bacterium 8376wG6]